MNVYLLRAVWSKTTYKTPDVQESLLRRSIKASFWLKVSTTSVRFNIITPLMEILAQHFHDGGLYQIETSP